MENSAAKPETTTNRQVLTEGVTLAVASVAAYTTTYAYESGYNAWYGLPAEFISIELKTVLFVFASLMTIGMLVNENVLHIRLARREGNLVWTVIVLLVLCGLLIGLPVINAPWKIGPTVQFLLVLGFFGVFGLILFSIRRGHTKVIADPHVKLSHWLLLYIFILATVAAYGIYTARIRDSYYVTNEGRVIVKIIDETLLICAPYDRETKTLWQEFTAVRFGEDSRLVLSLVTTGPLEPTPRKPSTGPADKK